MARAIDITGKQYGLLTPIKVISTGRKRVWKCLCSLCMIVFVIVGIELTVRN